MHSSPGCIHSGKRWVTGQCHWVAVVLYNRKYGHTKKFHSHNPPKYDDDNGLTFADEARWSLTLEQLIRRSWECVCCNSMETRGHAYWGHPCRPSWLRKEWSTRLKTRRHMSIVVGIIDLRTVQISEMKSSVSSFYSWVGQQAVWEYDILGWWALWYIFNKELSLSRHMLRGIPNDWHKVPKRSPQSKEPSDPTCQCRDKPNQP